MVRSVQAITTFKTPLRQDCRRKEYHGAQAAVGFCRAMHAIQRLIGEIFGSGSGREP
jgi:hypothetical protein